ncbi:4944_t:CDS:1 [Paraglomus occultum]|uniref:4944_t:CDS:1 n=1 Tax=Paraglomus occultum TaxID=144539 RepID=A0A9N9GT05_9GLOM|nr:4944_t:CDS:1 [Paraglomus occultum]
MLCKHLVTKKASSDTEFTLQFLNTLRRHDYPFIAFGQQYSSRIRLERNNPQEHNDQIMDESSEILDRLETMTVILDQQTVIEERRAMLANIKQLLIDGMDLAEENVQNDGFYDAFTKLVKPITEEITACKEVLNARTQQLTWQPPRNRRLPFYLN